MANAFLSSMIGMLDLQTVERIAACLGVSERSVSQGFQSSLAAVLATLASKSDDSRALRGMLELNPAALADTTVSDVVCAAADPSSPLIARGERLLPGLFGKLEGAVTEGVSNASGLRRGTASKIMAMAAPWALSFVNQRVRAEGLSMTGLGNLLHHETAAIRDGLPASLNHLLWPAAIIASSSVSEAAQSESSSMWWLLPVLALAALIPTAFWLVNRHSEVKPSETSQGPTVGGTGAANRATDNVSRVANKSIDTIAAALAGDGLRFGTGSSKLLPESEAKLNQIAFTLKAYPDVHATIGGYTDNAGNLEANLELSRQRADIVMAELVRRGISADRLSAEGYGQEDPVADNSTSEGRTENRRVTVSVATP